MAASEWAQEAEDVSCHRADMSGGAGKMDLGFHLRENFGEDPFI